MVRHRLRIRFRKEGDLRLIGHRDLARAWERVFRRAGVSVRMSEGFRPKPRMMFPSALAMGVLGADEVLEVELADDWGVDAVRQALEARLPEGLAINSIEPLAADARPARVARAVLELPVPPQRREALAARLVGWPAADEPSAMRGAGRKPVDLAAYVEAATLADGVLRLAVRFGPEGSARPRELLESLGVADLEREGIYLNRTAVELGT
jgi:radical SAM-linked protein